MRTLKFSFLFLLFFTLCITSRAQMSFNHSYGLGILLSNSGGPTIDYSPRLNILQFSDEMSLSLGSHMCLCAYADEYGGLYGISAPLVGEFNFGTGSGPKSMADVGGFIGGGLAFNLLNDFDGYHYNKATGPIINVGITTYLFGYPCGLRVSYLRNTNKKYLKRGYGDAITAGIYMVIE